MEHLLQVITCKKELNTPNYSSGGFGSELHAVR